MAASAQMAGSTRPCLTLALAPAIPALLPHGRRDPTGIIAQEAGQPLCWYGRHREGFDRPTYVCVHGHPRSEKASYAPHHVKGEK